MPSRVVIFDVETTGLAPARGHRIIEVGAVRLCGGKVHDEFHSLIDPGRKVPRSAWKVHGIGAVMLRGQPRPAEVFATFRRFIDGALLVAHNARFDAEFLKSEFARLRWPLTNRFQCTLELSRLRCPGLPNHRLETVARHLLGPLQQTTRLHRALDDARLTASVWLELGGD